KRPPFPANDGDAEPRADIHGQVCKLSDRDPALRAIDLRHGRIESTGFVACDALHKPALGIEPHPRYYRTRVAHEHNAILSHHGVVAALECSETRVEFMKLGGIEREDEDAAERAVRHRPATADGEERRVGHARDEDFR